MSEMTWELGAADGSVTVRTDVSGPAARTGHRLTIEMTDWSARVRWASDHLEALTATIAVGSLQVVSGEGGLTPLTGPEKSVARSNALKSLKATKFPEISFDSISITKSDNGYRVDGSLTICGRTRPTALDLVVEESSGSWRVGTECRLRHSDFGIKPYSLMMGALKVADQVRVIVEVTRSRSG